jgi:putative oxidoreductase
VTTLQRLPLALLFLRLGVFIVMLMWTLDKLVRPEHAAKVFEKFYFLSPSTGLLYLFGVVELVLVLAFVAGYMKRWTYGAVLVLHTLSTLASFGKYLDPWPNLLFFAAWPMLAACFALYYLREADTLLVLDRMREPPPEVRIAAP